MRHLGIFPFLLVLLSLSFSCKRDNSLLSSQLRAFMSTEIHYSGDALCVVKNHVKDTTLRLANCMVIYIDSTQCHKCRIDNLGDYNSLQSYCREKGVNVVILFSPSGDNVSDLLEELLEAKYIYPVFVDQYGVFAEMNPHIPPSLNFHAFLLNEEGFPIFVGDPIYSKSDKTLDLFKRVVDKRLTANPSVK